MKLLDYLRSVASSDGTVFTTFLQQYTNNNNYIHVFHEGKDDPSFYGNYIHRTAKKNQRIFYYKSVNKKGVYDHYEKINWTAYSKKRVLFLVDKDLADILGLHYPADINIFVTRFYSIENYLVNKHVFSRLLREVYGLDDDQVNYALTKLFKKGLRTYHSAALFISTYIVYHKSNHNGLNLQDLKFHELFTLEQDFSVTRKKGILKVLDKKTGTSTIGAYRSLKPIAYSLSKINNPKLYIRGKYELMYLTECLRQALTAINSSRPPNKSKYKASVSISNKNAIQIVAPRLAQPRDIRKFLIQVLK